MRVLSRSFASAGVCAGLFALVLVGGHVGGYVGARVGAQGPVMPLPVTPPGPPQVIVPPVVPPLPSPTPAPGPVDPKVDDLTPKLAVVVSIGGEVIGDEIAIVPLGRMAVCRLEGLPETPDGQSQPVVQWSYNEAPTDVQQRDKGHYFAFSSGMQSGKVYLLTASVSVEGGKEPLVASRWFVMGGHGPRPPPGPTPPEPPEPEPEPEPTPVVEGKRTVVIVRESTKDNAALSRLLINLRDGSAAAYFKSKGHVLDVLDVDQLKPSDPWRSHLEGMTPPAVFYIDTKTNTVVFKEPLVPTTTADNVIETLKRNGG